MELLYLVQISRSRSPQRSPCHTRTKIPLKIKTRISRLGEFYLFLVYFPILSCKDDISFRLELGSAHVKLDRLNQRPNLIVWVDLNRY